MAEPSVVVFAVVGLQTPVWRRVVVVFECDGAGVDGDGAENPVRVDPQLSIRWSTAR